MQRTRPKKKTRMFISKKIGNESTRIMTLNGEPVASNDDQFVKRILSAIFYAVSSCMIILVNKTVLTGYAFPSFQVLGIGQMIATLVILFVGKQCQIVSFPDLNSTIFCKIFPLPLIFIGNMIFGLGGTKKLSLPMFTALRKFSVLMTMILELYVLGSRPTNKVQLSVYVMVAGDVLAACNDLLFNVQGYVFVLLNDFFSATNGIYIKKKLDCKELGKYGLMFYNSLFMIMPATLLAFYTGDLKASFFYSEWSDPLFLGQFLISCVMGFILLYSIILCTFYNSALTTTIIGCLKNVCVTYLGMIIGGNYVFSWLNFIGLNVSVMGSLAYTYITFKKKVNSVNKEGPSLVV